MLPQQAIEAGWTDRQRQRAAFTEHGCLKRASRDIDERAMNETNVAERLAVASKRLLVLGASFDVLADEPGESSERDLAQLVDIECAFVVETAIVASSHFVPTEILSDEPRPSYRCRRLVRIDDARSITRQLRDGARSY